MTVRDVPADTRRRCSARRIVRRITAPVPVRLRVGVDRPL
jgi:hypothetical protein